MLGMTQPKEKKYILLVFHWHLLPFNGETIGSIRDRLESDKVTAKWPEKRENHKNQRHHAIEGVFWHWDFFARYRNWKGKPYALASLFFLLCFLHSFSLLRNLHHSKWGNKRCMEKIYNKNGKEYSSCFYWIDNDLKLWLFPFFLSLFIFIVACCCQRWNTHACLTSFFKTYNCPFRGKEQFIARVPPNRNFAIS